MSGSKQVVSRISSEDIAVIGMACRFPGGVSTPEEFWNLLAKGGNAITEVPPDRWSLDAYFDEDREASNKMYTKHGGFLKSIDRFDAGFFGISPREAKHMDPQQRLLLEVAWEAFENAGLLLKKTKGSDTGVFIGQSTHDYEGLLLYEDNNKLIGHQTASGITSSILANRLSNFFDFTGPSISMDTACSSSLIALHVACRMMKCGDCSQAVVGGVNVMLSPEPSIAVCKASMLSPDGTCKAFDKAANGYVRSEGVAIVILKPIDQAILDHDTILAVIKASRSNQDGGTDALTVPNTDSQIDLLRQILTESKCSANQIAYSEAHGTGTQVGDPSEAKALGIVFGQSNPKPRTHLMGSVKTNIGHTEPVAGLAGLIKTILAINKGQIPPNLHFNTPNPEIDFKELQLAIPTQLTPWPKNGEKRRLAIVNSFGFGGTNASVLLEHYREKPNETAVAGPVRWNQNRFIFPFSAKTDIALKEYMVRFNAFLNSQKESLPIERLAYTLGIRRNHFEEREAIVAGSRDELKEGIKFSQANVNRDSSHNEPSEGTFSDGLCFVYSGMGTQRTNMGLGIYETEPVFRQAMDTCADAFRQYLDWNLVDVLYRSGNGHQIDKTIFAQPAIFAVQYALTNLLKSWGIRPTCTIGHSVGEVSAACTAGVLSLENSVQVIYHRSRLQATTEGRGKMLSVDTPLHAIKNVLGQFNRVVSVAAVNSASSITLSGDHRVLTKISTILDQLNVFNRFLRVNVPYHSPTMDLIKEELAESLTHLNPCQQKIPLYSTVTGKRCAEGDYDGKYWGRNIREPVLFEQGLSRLLKDEKCRAIMEISPHNVLLSYARNIFADNAIAGKVFATLSRNEKDNDALLKTVSKLFTAGYPIQWHRMYPNVRPLEGLPHYAWRQDRYWQETQSSAERRLRKGFNKSRPLHPFLGRKQNFPLPVWKSRLNRFNVNFLKGHKLSGEYIFPGAGYIEIGLKINKEVYGYDECSMENVTFDRMLFLEKDFSNTIQSVFQPETNDYTIFSRFPHNGNNNWLQYAKGKISTVRPDGKVATVDIDKIKKECRYRFDSSLHYQITQWSYEGGFKLLSEIRYHKNKILAKISPNNRIKADIDIFSLYPGVVDSCFQLITVHIVTMDIETDLNPVTYLDEHPVLKLQPKMVYLPNKINKLKFYKETRGNEFYCYSTISNITPNSAVQNFVGLNSVGEVLFEAEGVYHRTIGNFGNYNELEKHLTVPKWIEAPFSISTPPNGSKPENWLIFCDEGDFGDSVSNRLILRGSNCIKVNIGDRYSKKQNDHYLSSWTRDSIARIFHDLSKHNQTISGIVYLWTLDIPGSTPFDQVSFGKGAELSCFAPMHLIQEIAEHYSNFAGKILFVTSAVHKSALDNHISNCMQASIWGFVRSAQSELKNLKLRLVDISPNVFHPDTFIRELHETDREREILLRGKIRYTNRLGRYSFTDSPPSKDRMVGMTPYDSPFFLKVHQTGNLHSIIPVLADPKGSDLIELQRFEVRIKVMKAGINFKDYLKAIGVFGDQQPIGMECAGIVVDIGSNVTTVAKGDAVVAIGENCIGSYVRTHEHCAAKKPRNMEFSAAATIPIAFLTAYYSIMHLAKLKRGERILIHTAASALGLAAVQLAKRKNAKIVATAGTDGKRKALKNMGIRHIYNSRSLSFADDIERDFGKHSIDVVINTLSGEYIEKSLSLVAPFGRFIELGKRDIQDSKKLSLAYFDRPLSYSSFELTDLFTCRQKLFQSIFAKLIALFEKKELTPLPFVEFPVTQTTEAFQRIKASTHIGKIVLDINVPKLEVRQKRDLFYGKTCLVTGGLGGLGLKVAERLILLGVKNLILTSRNVLLSKHKHIIRRLVAKRGTQVVTIPCDVGNWQMVDALSEKIDGLTPKLSGVIHAAGVLDDGILIKQNVEGVSRVLRPKVQGVWHLHRATLKYPLEFFICFSSIASQIGTAGQCNYAAANAFMDSFARFRQDLQLPAISINWGPWSEVGMASITNEKKKEQLANRGGSFILPEEGIEVLERLAYCSEPQIGAFKLNERMLRHYKSHPIFWQLLKPDGEPIQSDNFADTLHSLGEKEQISALSDLIRSTTAKVLDQKSVTSVNVTTRFFDMGFDSLMAVEMANLLQRNLGIAISSTAVFKHPTVSELTAFILPMLIADKEDNEPQSEKPDARAEQTTIDQMSKDELRKALGKELEELSRQ